MKKSILFGVFFALSFILLISLSSAYYLSSVRGISQDLVYTVTDLFGPVLDALFGSWSSVYVFETLLIFLIILCVVYVALGKVDVLNNPPAVRWILTIVIPLLSVRFFDYEWLITVFNSYKLLGIVITCIIPFILYFYFLYNASGDHGILRKLGWALFIAVYIGLWSSEHSGEYNSAVYFWTFIAGIVCLFGDDIIDRRLKVIEAMKSDRNFANREIARLNMQINEINQQVAAGAISHKEAEKAIKDLKSHIDWIRKK